MRKDDLVRYQFDGMTDEIYEWECLTPTVFLKKEYRQESAEKEMILSYLRAAEILYEGLTVDNNPVSHLKVIRDNQMCMPFLFMCRHALELSFKYKLNHETGKTVTGHKLDELFNKLKETNSDIAKNADVSLLVEILNEIDDDGCKLRYSKNKGETLYHEQPVFVKTDKILLLTKTACMSTIKEI